jgi:hypothetical protein
MVKDQAVWGIVQDLQMHRAQTVFSTVRHRDRHHVTQYTPCEDDGTHLMVMSRAFKHLTTKAVWLQGE